MEDVIKINEDFHLRQSKSMLKRPSNRTEQSDTQTDTLTESDPLPPGTQSMKEFIVKVFSLVDLGVMHGIAHSFGDPLFG